LIIGLLCLCAPTAFAGRIDSVAPLCAGGSLASYVSMGSAGCSAGDLTYFNFFFLALPDHDPVSPDTLIASAANITVTPPNLSGGGVNFYSPNFVVGAGDEISYLISYSIDPPPDILPGFDLEMDANSPYTQARRRLMP